MFNLVARRSYIVEGSELLMPKDFLQVDNFDQLFLDANELDIKTLRAQISQFQQTPSGALRLLVINNANNLSELLQNTLLKIVEEPPTKGVVIIQASSKESLLPTLRSRLEKIFRKRSNGVVEKKELMISDLFSMERNTVITELEQVISGLSLDTKRDVQRHNILDRTVRKLRQNVNLKLAIDSLDLNWRQDSGKE